MGVPMSLPFVREFRLGGPRGDGRHAYVNQDGAFLGLRVPLLEKDELGRWRARHQPALEKLLGVGYGVPVDLGWRMARFENVARALNKGDLSLAAIALVHAELPPLPDADRARWMAQSDGLAKYDPDEPRVAAGVPEGGEWTTDGGGGADRLRLSPGERIDELGDLLEWIANSEPEDEAAIRKEIKRLYYDACDTHGGDALNRALSDVIQSGGDRRERQAVLEDYESYTRSDPADVAQFGRNLITGALLSPLGLLPEATPAGTSVWELGWAARGQAIDEMLGADPEFPPNTPVIDAFPNGNAISIKSIDLNAAIYQDSGRLSSRINRYVDQLAEFNKLDWGDLEIRSADVTERTLKLAIPEYAMTDAQRAAIDIARARAQGMGINIRIYAVR